MDTESERASPMNKRWMQIGAVVGVILLLALCGGLGWLLVSTERAAAFRDILVILLAVETMIIGIFLMLMLWQLFQLIRLLRDEVVPLLDTTRETVDQVKHTTTFVGQATASPIITLSGYVRGARTMLATLRGETEPGELVRRARNDG